MSLTIKDRHGVILIEGAIDSTTVKKFKDHLEFLLSYSKSVTINIDKVTAICRDGFKVIEDLFKEAKLNNKAFCVVGYGCKDIYESINLSNEVTV